MSNLVKLADLQDRKRVQKRRDILSCLDRWEAFQGATGSGYVSLFLDGRCETYPVDSRSFADRVSLLHYRETKGRPLRASELQALQQRLRAEAHDRGPSMQVALRVSQGADGIFIDLSDRLWRSIRITPSEITIVNQSEVRFTRTSAMMPFPEPDLDGDLAELQALFPTLDETTWTLVLGAILAGFHPRGPYPILVITGGHRSGKSLLSLMIRRLLDPSHSPLRALPHRAEDLWVMAQSERLLVFDNCSSIRDGISDELVPHHNRRWSLNKDAVLGLRADGIQRAKTGFAKRNFTANHESRPARSVHIHQLTRHTADSR
jgi:putative DNA primase/helicase